VSFITDNPINDHPGFIIINIYHNRFVNYDKGFLSAAQNPHSHNNHSRIFNNGNKGAACVMILVTVYLKAVTADMALFLLMVISIILHIVSDRLRGNECTVK